MRKHQHNMNSNRTSGYILNPPRMLSAVINLIIVAVASAKAVACGAAP